MNNNCNFYEDRIWTGEFSIANDVRKIKVGGKLVYKKNRSFYLEITTLENSFLTPFAKRGVTAKIARINGYVKNPQDEKGKPLYVTLLNCTTDGSGAIIFDVDFDYALFSERRFFEEEDKPQSIRFFFNNWDEFNHPKGWKNEVGYSGCEDSFSLSGNIEARFCQSISSHLLLGGDNMFDRLFCATKKNAICEEEKREINEGLKNVLSKHLNKINVKDSETHRWFIDIKSNLPILRVSRIKYYLELFLTCLTRDFKTSLEKISIVSQVPDRTYPDHFDLLYNTSSIKTRNFSYSNFHSAFKKGSFDNEEWEVILNELLSRALSEEDLLDNFFFALQENHLENSAFTPFSVTRAIDCLDAIASNKGYDRKNKDGKSEKYQNVISWFLANLDPNTQSLALQFVDEQLDYITTKPTDNKKHPCSADEIRGLKISALRAKSVHFGNNTSSGRHMDMSKASKLLCILELIIADFIFEELQLPQKQRNKYKTCYLNRLPWF